MTDDKPTRRLSRRIIVEMNVSIDGFAEGPDEEMGWVVHPGNKEDVVRFFNGFDTIFYGRTAYERLGCNLSEEGMLDDHERTYNFRVNAMRKYVFSQRLRHVRGNAMVIYKDFLAEISRIRGEDGKNIWFCGGPSLLKSFIEHDLIDEYRLIVQPVALGSGKRLFQSVTKPVSLKLVRIWRMDGGVVMLCYRPSSSVNGCKNDRSI